VTKDPTPAERFATLAKTVLRTPKATADKFREDTRKRDKKPRLPTTAKS
jgi:hypothetical protein